MSWPSPVNAKYPAPRAPQQTPAPWSVITTPNGDQFVGNAQLMRAVCLSPDLPLEDAVRDWPINARLIAAAPELAEVLRALVRDYAREIGVPVDQCVAGAVGKARLLLERIDAR